MRYLVLGVFFAAIHLGVFGQFQKILGTNNTNNYAFGVTTDNSGNIYMGATTGQNGWLVKMDSGGSVLWSKSLSDSPNNAIDVSTIEVVGDTVFGCGWFKTGTTIKGSFYFKVSAIDGSLYWLKGDPANKSYFSSMKYYNGKYFLTGSVTNGNSNYDGKVICVNSSTGDLIWQSQGIGIGFANFNNDYIDDFMSSTDMVNGKMFITGRSYVNGSVINMRPLMIGIDEFGVIFCKKHLMFDPQNTAGIKRIYGMQIDYTAGQDSLVVGWFGDAVCSGSCNNYLSGLVKTDLQGNVSFTKMYDMQGHAFELLTEMVITDKAYYFFGTIDYGTSSPRNYITKVSRNGDFIKSKLISNGTNNLVTTYGGPNIAGRASYNNGLVYFTSKMYQGNVSNSNTVLHVFDEDLSDIQNCFTSQNLNATVTNYPNFSEDLSTYVKATTNNHAAYQILANSNYVDNCTGIVIDTVTSVAGGVTTITASSPQIASPSFEWSNGATSSQTTFTSDTLILKITNPANCCFAIDTFVVSPCNITFNLGNDRTLCSGQTLVLNAPAGYTYLWSDNSTGNQLTVNTAGTYWLEASNGPCSFRDSIVIAYQNLPSVNLGNDTTLCDDQLISWTFNMSGVTYLWQNNSTANSLTAQTSGLYWLEVNNGACTFRDSVQVTYLGAPQVDLGNDRTLCSGQTLVLTAPAGLTYLWNDNSTGNQLTVNSPGTYWLEASNAQCADRDSIVVTYQNPPSVNLGNDTTLCDDQLISWSFNLPGVTYLWQNNSTANSLTAQTSGLYWLEVNNGSCSFRDSVQVTYLNAPQVDLGNDTTMCTGETLVLTAPAGLTYLWSDNSTGNQLTVSSAGTYWLEASNTNCSVRDSIVIGYLPPPSVNLGNDTTLCDDQLISWSFNNPGYTYLWQNNSAANSLTAQTSGLYWLEVDNGACTFRDSAQVTYLSAPQVDLGSDRTLCSGQTLVLTAPAGLTYLWSDNSTGSQLTVTTAGTYWLEASNTNCSVRDSIVVSYVAPPTVSIGNDTTLCTGETITLQAISSGNVSYLWSTNSVTDEITVNQAGIYWVQVSNGSCAGRDSMQLSYQAYPQIDLGNDTTLCKPNVLLLSLPNTFSSYLWSDNSTGNSILVSQEGKYTVVAGQNGCASKDSIYVSFIQKFSVITDTTVCLDSQVLLPANYPAGTYLWEDGSDGPYLQVTEPGRYELDFFNICGTNEIVFDVAFKNCACYLYIPNTFTPDADEHNPRFEVKHECDFKSFHLEIYDRWGELIFESYDPAVGWDGTYANFGMVQDDVYVWKLNYVDNISLNPTTRVGHVSVIK